MLSNQKILFTFATKYTKIDSQVNFNPNKAEPATLCNFNIKYTKYPQILICIKNYLIALDCPCLKLQIITD